ncbi:hypothetical protein F2P79_009640 [Pimephales promelas]|nr:hypothetical protein F2P79_009640 [Pimephales promelas]
MMEDVVVLIVLPVLSIKGPKGWTGLFGYPLFEGCGTLRCSCNPGIARGQFSPETNRSVATLDCATDHGGGIVGRES